ncbi:MAG: helix-turn-helix transcriptional regulator [Acidimicrobiales bacterium]
MATCATISLAEAAQILGIHRTTAWSLYKRREFPVPVLKVGSNLRVVMGHLQRFMETGEPVAPGARIGASTSIAS